MENLWNTLQKVWIGFLNFSQTILNIFWKPIWNQFEPRLILLQYRALSGKLPEFIWTNSGRFSEKSITHSGALSGKFWQYLDTVWKVWDIIWEIWKAFQKVLKNFQILSRKVWKTFLNTIRKIIWNPTHWPTREFQQNLAHQLTSVGPWVMGEHWCWVAHEQWNSWLSIGWWNSAWAFGSLG